MYRESFLQRLAQLELQITNDSTYDIYTRSVLADLVEYVEGGKLFSLIQYSFYSKELQAFYKKI